jgi:hypothetical protein
MPLHLLMPMASREVKRLTQATKEGSNLEFKKELSEEVFRDLSKEIAAFANTDGGSIIFGKLNTGQNVGVEVDSEKLARVHQEASACRPPVPIKSQEEGSGRNHLLIVRVEKSNYIHCDKNNRFPYRAGNTTSYMETSMILAQAKLKGLITGELIQTGFAPRKEPKDEDRFIVEQLDALAPEIATEALADLQSGAYRVKLEGIPELLPKLKSSMTDTHSKVRLGALGVLDRLLYPMDREKKSDYVSALSGVLGQLAMSDPEVEIRRFSLALLCSMGEKSAIDIIVKLATNEKEETYSKLGVEASARNLVDSGLGARTRVRIYEELRKAHSVEAHARLQKVLEMIRNTHWPD